MGEGMGEGAQGIKNNLGGVYGIDWH